MSALSFKERFQRELKQKGLTVAGLSKLSGVPKTTLHGWTTGAIPGLEHLRKVAQTFKTSIHELAYGEPDPFHVPSREVLKELFSGDLRVTIHKIEREKK